MSIKAKLNGVFMLLVLVQANTCLANEKEKQAVIDQKIKLKTLSVVKNASQLVEDVAYPEISRLKIYLSHSAGKFFSLKKVSVVLNGQDKSSSTYNDLQQKALLRGGSNRIHIASIIEGFHELVVVFEGRDRGGNVIKKAETWLFDKKPGEMIIVVKVKDNEKAIRPDFEYSIIKGK